MQFPQHYNWLRLVETGGVRPPLAFGKSLGRAALPRVHSRPWQGPSPVVANDHTGDHTIIGIRSPELYAGNTMAQQPLGTLPEFIPLPSGFAILSLPAPQVRALHGDSILCFPRGFIGGLMGGEDG